MTVLPADRAIAARRASFEASSAFLHTVAFLLALLHAVLAVTATVQKSMTADEIAHLAAGYTYTAKGDFRMQPENGNLPQRLAGFPMVIGGVTPPEESGLWAWKNANIWGYGHAFFFEREILSDQWLFLGRSMIALVSAATAILVFEWSWVLFGRRGALLSLVLFVFSPTFLAHGALATSDIVVTFLLLASTGAWWRHLEVPGLTWATLSALAFGTAFVAKFSAVLLPLMLGIISLIWIISRAGECGWKAPLWRLCRTSFIHAATAVAVIWLFYGFRYSAFAPALSEGADFNHGWSWALGERSLPTMFIEHLRDWRLLPEAWLYGLAFVLKFSHARGAFMSGEYSVTGWVDFFPFAFLIKTTLPLLLLVATTVTMGTIRARRCIAHAGFREFANRTRPLIPLAVLFIVYWLISLSSNLNIGHRHILPVYPVLFIMLGWLGHWFDFRRPLPMLGIAITILWHAGESMHVRPHYLAYFNQIIGGPQNGWRHLVDSSLDWGQDLPGLKRWLDENAREGEIFLSYFGTADPAYEGIHATALPTLPEVGPPRKWHPLSAGTYAISATMLQHVYSPIRGDWTSQLEKEYQQLRALEGTMLLYQRDQETRKVLLAEAPAERWDALWRRYEGLRFARLCHYLRVREPDGVIGYSILAYELNASEIEGAVGGSIIEWRDLIDEASRQRREGLR